MNYIESLFFKEFENIVFFFIICSSLSFIILFLSISITVSAPDPEKSSSYECGFDPYGDARNMFDVRFYLVAILFIVFDLESIYFFPWCTSFSFLNYNEFFTFYFHHFLENMILTPFCYFGVGILSKMFDYLGMIYAIISIVSLDASCWSKSNFFRCIF